MIDGAKYHLWWEMSTARAYRENRKKITEEREMDKKSDTSKRDSSRSGGRKERDYSEDGNSEGNLEGNTNTINRWLIQLVELPEAKLLNR